jgi:hypothetical protein
MRTKTSPARSSTLKVSFLFFVFLFRFRSLVWPADTYTALVVLVPVGLIAGNSGFIFLFTIFLPLFF